MRACSLEERNWNGLNSIIFDSCILLRKTIDDIGIEYNLLECGCVQAWS